MSRRIIINLVAFAVLAVGMTWWAFTNLLNVHPLTKTTRVYAQFSNASGVHTDSEVTYLGVHTGTVRAVTLEPYGVRVAIALAPGSVIPADASAHIWRKSAIGEQYVDLSPPEGWNGTGATMANGDVIPLARTAIPVDFSNVLRSSTTLVGSIDPSDLATLVHELAVGLRGNADELRSLVTGGDRLAQTLAARTAELDRLLTNNTTLTHVFAAHAPSIQQTLADLRSVSQSLAAASTDIAPLVQRGNQLLAQLVPILQQHEADLSCTIAGLGSAASVAGNPQHVADLRTALPLLPGATELQLKTTDIDPAPDGTVRRWQRLGVVVNPDNPPDQFVPFKPKIPPIQPVGTCTPASAGLTRTAAVRRLPASGDDPYVVGVLLYAAGTAAFWVRRRPQVR
jgi:phospholipid/cholesterol/gamma-HCH transport system substrate-binding protein